MEQKACASNVQYPSVIKKKRERKEEKRPSGGKQETNRQRGQEKEGVRIVNEGEENKDDGGRKI